MAILKLLADMMVYLLKAPFALLQYLNVYAQQRMATAKAIEVVGKESKATSKASIFFSILGLVLLWLILVAVIVAIFVGLWYLNDRLNLERVLGGPWPSVRPYWLPLLFLLFCISCFVGFRLYRSLGPDRDEIEFADLEDAWVEAKAALVDSGIVITETPLFLVLGRNASNLHALLSASRLPFAVQQVPLKANPPLQVYANKQAVYVVAPDASLLGRQAELLYEAAVGAEPEAARPAAPSVFEEPPEPETSSAPKAAVAPLVIDPMLSTQNLLAEPSGGTAMAVMPAPQVESAAMPWETAGRRRMPALVKRTEEVDKYKRRLRYLARRLLRDRAPFCPLNGVLLLIPFDALETDEDASQVASIINADLQVLQETARTRCPVLVLVTDLETAPGYTALSERLDADRRARLFGQDLPLLPDVKAEHLPQMISGSLRHFSQALTQWIFRLLRVEKSMKESAAECIAGNSRLFELLGAIRKRETALDRILARILACDPHAPPGDAEQDAVMLGGFYLAATGANADRDQAFVPGVFQQLVQNQNAVAWTAEALTEEADYRRWTTYGYAALAIFLIAVIAIIYGRWQLLHW